MTQHIQQIDPQDFPAILKEITDPPEKLYLRGTMPAPSYKTLAVVGSRSATAYGREVVEYLIHGLRGYPVAIVSGMALGIDGAAHTAALDAGLPTVAVLGCGLSEERLHPRAHVQLAHRILDAGGALLSEFEPDQQAAPWTFPQRNRIVVGLSGAVLIIEAAERSGSLITARLAVEYNRELLVVPGSIFAASSKGAHQFLKLGATPATTPEDILEALRIPPHATENTEKDIALALSPEEQELYDALAQPCPRDELIAKLSYSVTTANILLSKLELEGVIVEKFGTLRRV